jgi:WD40 repeat protein
MEEYEEVFKGNLDTGERRAFIAASLDISTIALSPDGSILAAGNYGGQVKLYGTGEGNVIRQIQDPETVTIINCIRWSPNGNFLAYSDGEGKLVVLNRNLDIVKTIHTNSQGDSTHTIDWNGAGNSIVSGDALGDVKVWNNVTTGPDLSADQASINMHIFADNEEHPNAEQNIGPVISVAWSPRQEVILSCEIGEDVDTNLFQYWEVHNPDGTVSGEELEYTEDEPYSAREMVWNREGTHMAQACSDGKVRIERYDYHDFDAHSIESLQGTSNDGASSVAWSANGRFIVGGFFDNSVRVWEWPSKRLVAVLRGHTDSVTSVAINANGSIIFTGSLDRTIRKWAKPLIGNVKQDIKIGQKNTGKLDFDKDNRASKYTPMPKSKIDYTTLLMSVAPTLETQYRATIAARGVTHKKRTHKKMHTKAKKGAKKHRPKTHHKRSKHSKGKGKKHTKKHHRRR